MKTIIFSDVHGNLSALKELISITRKGNRKYICLGDTLGYGPHPMECLELVFKTCHIITLGWHDVAGLLPSLQGLTESETQALRSMAVNFLTPIHQATWKVHGPLVPYFHPMMDRLRRCPERYIQDDVQYQHHLTRPPQKPKAFVGHHEEAHVQAGKKEYRGLLGGLRAEAIAVGSVGMCAWAADWLEWAEVDADGEVSLKNAQYDTYHQIKGLREMGYSPAMESAILDRAAAT